MDNNFELDDLEDFKIDPHVWLRTLLAIVGDKERKAEVIQAISARTGFPSDKVETIMTTTISVLMKDTCAN